LLACGDTEESAQVAEPGSGIDARPADAPAPPPPDPEEDARTAFGYWAPLIRTGDVEEARSLCTTWLERQEKGYRSEAHKCLANVEILYATSEPDLGTTLRPGASSLEPRIDSGGVDVALEHYRQTLEIMPDDADAHLGRIDILILAGRYREANTALDETLSRFSSREMLAKWLSLIGRFRQLGRYAEGLAFLQVIEKHHPLDHRVVANLGAFYGILGADEKALTYSKKAVAINPDDPINRWNLGRLYEHDRQLDAADVTYQEALALFRGRDPDAQCYYAEFLADQILDVQRACAYSITDCIRLYQERCDDPIASSLKK
jgi:tetratricopeptide (TPR) repeat protein